MGYLEEYPQFVSQDNYRYGGFGDAVPCAPVMSMLEIENDPDLIASGSIVEVEHKVRGTYKTVGSPIKFSSFAPDIKESPLLGEHTDEVLTSLGYTPEQITKLHEAKVVGSTGKIPQRA